MNHVTVIGEREGGAAVKGVGSIQHRQTAALQQRLQMVCPSLRVLAVLSHPLQEATDILQRSVLLIQMPVKIDLGCVCVCLEGRVQSAGVLGSISAHQA